MNIIQNYLQVQKTARYFSIASPKSIVKNIWILLHGYSQQAGEFIKQFDVLDDNQSLIIAPEGLSRFYVKGYFGNVGASWMTKEDRLNDILNNVNYLDDLLIKILDGLNAEPEKTIVLGYSQGGATAVRWAAVTNHKIDNLIIHSSDFPKDISDESLEILNKKTKTIVIYSNKDEFIDETVFEEQFRYLEEKKFGFEKILFDGKHEIKREVLIKLKDRLC